jgi:hypothetical protein
MHRLQACTRTHVCLRWLRRRWRIIQRFLSAGYGHLDLVRFCSLLVTSGGFVAFESAYAFLKPESTQEHSANQRSDAAASAAAHHVRRKGCCYYCRCISKVARCVFHRCHCQLSASGGWNGVASLRDVHVFDIHSCAWSAVETKGVTWNGWSGSAFALANDGVSLLVFGGHSSSQVRPFLRSVACILTPRQMTNESRIYNAATSSWTSPPVVVRTRTSFLFAALIFVDC